MNSATHTNADSPSETKRKEEPILTESSSEIETKQEPQIVKEYLFKILVVGDLGTGKTSIIKRYVHNIFSMNYKSTIGVDFALKVLQYSQNTLVRLQLWDIAGQERFGNMTRVYYKEAVGALVVFDVTRSSTFEGVSKWKADIDEKVRLANDGHIPVVLVANKIDLGRESGLAPSTEQLKAFCEERGFAGVYETSAKDNQNIAEALQFLVSKILENERLLQQHSKSSKSDNNGNGNSGNKNRNIVKVGSDSNATGSNPASKSGCC